MRLGWVLLLAGCFEAQMVRLGADAWVDPATTVEERQQVQRMLADADAIIQSALAKVEAEPPLAIFCKSERCITWFTGDRRRSWTLAPHDRIPGADYVNGARPTIIIVRTDRGALGHLAHERVHTALGFGRRGLAGKPYGLLPLWFHEGLAALIAGEPACGAAMEKGIDDLRRLDKNAAWADYTQANERRTRTYCQARAEVETWLRRFGMDRLFELLDSVRGGARFYDRYGPMLTQ